MQALGDALGTPLGNALRSSSVHALAHALGMPLRNALRSTSAVHASGFAFGQAYASMQVERPLLTLGLLYGLASGLASAVHAYPKSTPSVTLRQCRTPPLLA